MVLCVSLTQALFMEGTVATKLNRSSQPVVAPRRKDYLLLFRVVSDWWTLRACVSEDLSAQKVCLPLLCSAEPTRPLIYFVGNTLASSSASTSEDPSLLGVTCTASFILTYQTYVVQSSLYNQSSNPPNNPKYAKMQATAVV